MLDGDPIKNLSDDSKEDISDRAQEQWMARHNDMIIGFYGNKDDANYALDGYKMEQSIDINDELEVRQII